MICHNCGHDAEAHTVSNYDERGSRYEYCTHPKECECSPMEMRAADKGYRKGAEEALRLAEGAIRFIDNRGEPVAVIDVERVRKEMGLESC